jgi:cytochrome c oxidase assembly protein subunit 15
MDGAIIPDNLFVLEPAWRNLFENPKTVQFIHRCGAYTVFLCAFAQMIFTMIRAPRTTHARRAILFFLLVTLQAALGITTLLMQVPIDLGLAHQAMAIIVLGFAAAHWRGTKGSYPIEKETLARA